MKYLMIGQRANHVSNFSVKRDAKEVSLSNQEELRSSPEHTSSKKTYYVEVFNRLVGTR